MSILQDTIRKLAKDDTVAGITIGRVTAVDKDARTVDVQPLDGEAPLLGLNLQANQKGTVGLVQIPKIDSCVIVGTFTNYGGAGAVLLCDDVERIEATVGNYSLEITDEGISLNGGNLGGLVKVTELTQRLNAIERDLNALKTAFSSWAPVAQDGGAALKAATGSWYSQTLAVTQQNDIENQDIKQ